MKLTECACPVGWSEPDNIICTPCAKTAVLRRAGDIGAREPTGRAKDTKLDVEAWQRFLNRWRLEGQLPADIEAVLNGVVVIKFEMLSIDANARRRAAGFFNQYQQNPMPAATFNQEFRRNRTYPSVMLVTPPEQFDSISLAVDLIAPTSQPCEASVGWVRSILRWMYLHELDEWIRIDGAALFDPHARTVPPTPENS